MKKYPIYVKFTWTFDNTYAIWKLNKNDRGLCIFSTDPNYQRMHGMERDRVEDMILREPDNIGVDVKKEIIDNPEELFLELI